MHSLTYLLKRADEGSDLVPGMFNYLWPELNPDSVCHRCIVTATTALNGYNKNRIGILVPLPMVPSKIGLLAI